jgi:hypothetical protein
MCSYGFDKHANSVIPDIDVVSTTGHRGKAFEIRILPSLFRGHRVHDL